MPIAKPRFQQVEQPSAEQAREDGIVAAYLEIPANDVFLSTWAAPLDQDVLLGSLRDGRLKVQSPFVVRLTTEAPHVIAEAAEFNEFGFGMNWSEAMIDLQRAIAELYFTLNEEQNRLGPDLQQVWTALQQKIALR